MTIKILYFAWLREKVGKSEETVDLPADTRTISELVAWLRTRGPEYEEAFKHPAVVRAALDQVHVKPDTAIGDAREIAFFPPVTGG
jgi:molybdopterin synthase sulfur carrier subunit